MTGEEARTFYSIKLGRAKSEESRRVYKNILGYLRGWGTTTVVKTYIDAALELPTTSTKQKAIYRKALREMGV